MEFGFKRVVWEAGTAVWFIS